MTKLENVFIGVSETSKAYKLFNPSTKNIVTSKDVVFDEENTRDWNRQQPTQVFLDENDEKGQTLASSTFEKIAPIVTKTSPTNNDNEEELSPRIRKRPAWMDDFLLTRIPYSIIHFALFSDCDPTTFESAVKEEKWQKTMNDEIDAIERNDTWELCDLPKEHKTIGVKWVFKTKLKENGEVDKYKARLVAKGYKQQYGIDYTKVFSQVARHDTIRLMIALVA